uniref:Fervidolysin. Serine peptidase. MEROPS family S08A n=1 Tax=Solibacter usitatus (strain Ellin6076) TaxID=234267 RepID=Q021G4_SOLUE
MSRRLHISVRISLLIALFSLGAFAEDRFLVKVNGDINALARHYGLTVVQSLGGSATGMHVLSSKGANPHDLARSLAAEFSVRSVEPDNAVILPGIKPASAVVRSPASTSGFSISSTLVRYHNSYVASGYVNQPAVGLINMASAQKMSTGGGIVATIDTGADFTHPGLLGSLTPGWDFVNNLPFGQEQADINKAGATVAQETTPILDQETTPILDGGTAIILTQETTPILDQETTPILDGTKYPAFGHGTMVASLIHLVAPDARIMPLRAFGANGSSSISQIVAAVHYAVEHNVDVINMSFSVSSDSPALKDAMEFAFNSGLVLVAAAGNSGQAATVYPAAYSTVMGVGATDNFLQRAFFSNFGQPLVTLAAPGQDIIAMYPMNHYAKVSGTSFSAPLVAGGAALLVDLNKKLNETSATAALSHAHALAPGLELGAGELDLFQACMSLPRSAGGNW